MQPEELLAPLSEEQLSEINALSTEALFDDLSTFTAEADVEQPEELTATQIALESLQSTLMAIGERGVICRSDTQTLIQMTTSMEGFEDAFELMPLGSFTELPSKVNYQASMENLLSRIAQKIIETIKRMIAWFKGKYKEFASRLSGNNVAQAKLAALGRNMDAQLRQKPAEWDAQAEIETIEFAKWLLENNQGITMASLIKGAAQDARVGLPAGYSPGLYDKLVKLVNLMGIDHVRMPAYNGYLTIEHSKVFAEAIKQFRSRQHLMTKFTVPNRRQYLLDTNSLLTTSLSGDLKNVSTDLAAGLKASDKDSDRLAKVRAQAFMNNYADVNASPEYRDACALAALSDVIGNLHSLTGLFMRAQMSLFPASR